MQSTRNGLSISSLAGLHVASACNSNSRSNPRRDARTIVGRPVTTRIAPRTRGYTATREAAAAAFARVKRVTVGAGRAMSAS